MDWKTIGLFCGFLGLGGGQVTTILSSSHAEQKVVEVKEKVESDLTSTAKDLKEACAGLIGPPMPPPDCINKEDMETILKEICE